MDKVMDSFMNDEENSFMQQFEKHRYEKLSNREDYKNLENQKLEIFDEFPKVRNYLQDGEIVDFTDDEKDAVLRLLTIEQEIETIEKKEVFKLGAKEMYIFLKETNMISI